MAFDKKIIYRINHLDQIIFVNDEWDEFAKSNSGEKILSAHILNHSLWNFIVDRTTKEIYRQALLRIRSGDAISFEFRCDSPNCRRLLKMNISLLGNSIVEFATTTLSIENREPLLPAYATTPVTEQLLRVCSWCNRMYVNNCWVDLETAVKELKLLERSVSPLLTHGICEECFSKMQSVLRN